MLETNSQLRGDAKGLVAGSRIEVVQQVGAHLDEEKHFRGDAVAGGPGAPVVVVNADFEVDEAVCERGRHAVHDGAVLFAVAAGDDRGAFGELVFAELAFQAKLVQRGLDHGDAGREFFQVEEEAACVVGGREEDGGRPAGPAFGIAPGDAAQVDGIEEQGSDVDIDAVQCGGDLAGHLALGAAGRAPDQSGLARVNQEGEDLGEFGGAKRVVGRDGLGIGHAWLQQSGG